MRTALFALFPLALITSKLPSSTASEVFDVDGDYLRSGDAYNILPVSRGRGGGLGLAVTGNETCPLTVVQSRSKYSHGLPVKILSGAETDVICQYFHLDIAFAAVPTCAPTAAKWTVVEKLPEGWFTKIGDKKPGWFTIEKCGSDYKLVFCPSSGWGCGNLGISVDNHGNRRLAVSPDPFKVVFKKFSSSSAV